MIKIENFLFPYTIIPLHKEFWGIFSFATPYMGAKVWYVSRLAETYTRTPDIYPVGMIVVTL